MNKSILILAAALTLSATSGAFGQTPPRPVAAALSLNSGQGDASKLTKFSLDFPGGTPKQLVAAIEKAMSKPINVIVQNADAGEQLPPLKLSNVTVPELFNAVGNSSGKSVPYVTSSFGSSQSYSVSREGYSFQTGGPQTDESVWYFIVERSPFPSMNQAKTCRYYSLAKYIDAGTSVEDITTAIQTGWKMMGESSTPDLRFHKETKLLIAVGAPGKLETIEAVLKALNAYHAVSW